MAPAKSKTKHATGIRSVYLDRGADKIAHIII